MVNIKSTIHLIQNFLNIERIEIIACGTSKHAAMVGSFLLEQFSGIPTNVFYAS